MLLVAPQTTLDTEPGGWAGLISTREALHFLGDETYWVATTWLVPVAAYLAE